MKSRRTTMAAAAAGTVSALTGLALAGLALAGSASAATAHPARAAAGHGYTFTTLNNHRDVTFNQLLGINNHGVIAGYFGSGAAGHPNKGYLLEPPYRQHSYVNENFPHSAQTQVTGLNGVGNTVGFFANKAGANFGFYTTGRHFKFHKVDFPHASNAHPQMDQLLGINSHGEAVGFYLNFKGLDRGYEYNIHTHHFSRIAQPGVTVNTTTPSLTATAINNAGDVAGFYTNKHGATVGFIKHPGGSFRSLNFPGASMTQIFGINNHGEVVGAYTVGTSSTPPTYGFTWTKAHGFRKVNDPHGIGSTLINGVNDSGELVGFYTDSAGNTDGFIAVPKR